MTVRKVIPLDFGGRRSAKVSPALELDLDEPLREPLFLPDIRSRGRGYGGPEAV